MIIYENFVFMLISIIYFILFLIKSHYKSDAIYNILCKILTNSCLVTNSCSFHFFSIYFHGFLKIWLKKFFMTQTQSLEFWGCFEFLKFRFCFCILQAHAGGKVHVGLGRAAFSVSLFILALFPSLV